MATLLPIADIIEIGDVSVYLSSNDNSRGALFGKRLSSPYSAIEIAAFTDALRWQYETYPSDDTLRATANYCLWCYGKYGQQAYYIISGTSGGEVVPISGERYIWYALLTTFGDETIDINATAVFSRGVLVGATSVTTLSINGQIKYLNTDFTFDSAAGEVTLLNGNLFYTGDVIAMQFYRKIN